MASATIGTGVIILLIMWAVAIVTFVLFCSAQGKLKYVSIVPTAVAALVTIILVFIPRGNDNLNPGPGYNYSYIPLIWILTLTVLFLFLAAASFVYLATDIMQPRYAVVDRGFSLR